MNRWISRETAAAIVAFLASPRLVSALTTVIVGVGICAFALRQTVGWAGLIGILGTLVLIAGLSLAARWREVEWRTPLSISLLLFVGWAMVSIVWSQYRWATLGGLAYGAAFTVLGVYIALMRDTIQVVRGFGDVFRFVLVLSLGIEIFAGVVIDTPIAFLHVLGTLGELGPIQGIMGARNQLGIIAVIAILTFGTELRTHVVSRGLTLGSLVLAVVTLVLTRSPLAFGALIVVLLAAAALYGLRRVEPEHRRLWQLGLLAGTVLAGAFAWSFRSGIVQLFNAGGDLTYRLALWRKVWELISVSPLQGWGWIGAWHEEILPFRFFSSLAEREENSASNAFLDVWFQLGLVGMVLFVVLVGLAFVRSWLLASRKRSVVYAWPALALVALVTTALAESSLLSEFGWLTFVVCTLKAAQELSWRKAFEL